MNSWWYKNKKTLMFKSDMEPKQLGRIVVDLLDWYRLGKEGVSLRQENVRFTLEWFAFEMLIRPPSGDVTNRVGWI